jgi:hypothetical protein
VTDTRLMLSAEAIVPGHSYSARLADLAAGDTASSAELASWVLDAPSAVAALHRLIERERHSGGLNRDEAAHLHEQVGRESDSNDTAPGSGCDVVPSGDEFLPLDVVGTGDPRAYVAPDQHRNGMPMTEEIGLVKGFPPGSGSEHRHAHPLPGPDQSPTAPTAGQPGEDRWYDTVRRIAGEAVVQDPGWPGLAAGLDRALAAGWDVPTHLPRLVAQVELPRRQPAGELYYRLLADCAAAAHSSTVSVEDINRATPASVNSNPSDVGYTAPEPVQRGPNQADGGPRH